MVRPLGEVLWVRAVADVGAVKTCRECSVYNFAFGGRELLHRCEVAGEDPSRVKARSEGNRVDEFDDEIVERVEDR